ncbi:MAG TPA: hypothetical protein V6C96_04045, partial [Vampirovibrionales bacterium]
MVVQQVNSLNFLPQQTLKVMQSNNAVLPQDNDNSTQYMLYKEAAEQLKALEDKKKNGFWPKFLKWTSYLIGGVVGLGLGLYVNGCRVEKKFLTKRFKNK